MANTRSQQYLPVQLSRVKTKGKGKGKGRYTCYSASYIST